MVRLYAVRSVLVMHFAHLQPIEAARTIAEDLLFPVNVPPLGNRGTITAPRFLNQCALDSAYRVADAMGSAKGERTVHAVIRRLESEAE